jgi:hypothetical protein
VPRDGGDITGLAFLNETLIVFKETRDLRARRRRLRQRGGGQNFGPARMLASDVGAVSHEAIGVTPGGLVFKSHKGWYLLNRGWAVQYIGAPVADYDSDDVVAVHVLESQHQVRCLTSSRCWCSTTSSTSGPSGRSRRSPRGVCDGTYHYRDRRGVRRALGLHRHRLRLDVETAWIPFDQIQGFGRVWQLLVLGEYRGACRSAFG